MIAKDLSGKLDAARYQLIVINPRTFEVFYPPLVRAIVTAEGAIENGLLNPISKVFANGNGSVKTGRVARVEHAGEKGAGGHVVLESGEELEFAVLVLAPGSSWEGPLALPDTREEVDKHLAEWRAKFQAAKHVVLAGGGAVGIGGSILRPLLRIHTYSPPALEIAGEIKDAYPVRHRARFPATCST